MAEYAIGTRVNVEIRRDKKGKPSVVVTTDNAIALSAHRDAIVADCATALASYGHKVTSEIAQYETLTPNHRVASVAIFAVLSAQGAFGPNCDAIAPVSAYLRSGGRDHDTVSAILASVGYGQRSRDKIRAVIELADIVCDGTTLDRDDLYRNVRGFGLKTSAMATALFDHTARVMTLDSWMLNGMCGLPCTAKKNKYAVTYNVGAYRIIEAMLLSIADELNVAPFVLQWTLWNYYRNNAHESHLRIFGL